MCFLIWPSLVHTLSCFRREHGGFACESSFAASNQKGILIPQYFSLPPVFPSPHPSVRLCHSFVTPSGYFAPTYLVLWDPLCADWLRPSRFDCVKIHSVSRTQTWTKRYAQRMGTPSSTPPPFLVLSWGYHSCISFLKESRSVCFLIQYCFLSYMKNSILFLIWRIAYYRYSSAILFHLTVYPGITS